jgi:hypothetical protein
MTAAAALTHPSPDPHCAQKATCHQLSHSRHIKGGPMIHG